MPMSSLFFFFQLELTLNIILVLGIQHSVRHLYNKEVTPLEGLVHSYYNIINSLYCTLYPYDYFLTANLYFLIPLPFSTRPPISLPHVKKF